MQAKKVALLIIITLGLIALLEGCGGEANTTVSQAPTTSIPNSVQATQLQTTQSAIVSSSTLPASLSPATTTVAVTSAPTPTRPPAQTATAVPATATPAPIATATKPAPLLPRYIEALRNRTYNGGEIKLDKLYSRTEAYTANLIYYQSDGLKISGLMFVPNGPAGKKYPVALINHGYFNPTPADYDSGWDTLRELIYFARNGYITIASDYRNYARSDKGDNEREPGYVVDILNLIEAVKKFPQADPNQLTIMGHSMGGEITLTAMVVSPDIKVAGLFGTMSPDTVDNYNARLVWQGGKSARWVETYGTPQDNPQAYRQMSPLTYFKDVKVPTIIHIGNNDTTTPPAWSVKTRDALVAAGKKAELYTYPGQGHSLNSPAFEQAMQRTLSFFNAGLGR